jgi:hypothetical protein
VIPFRHRSLRVVDVRLDEGTDRDPVEEPIKLAGGAAGTHGPQNSVGATPPHAATPSAATSIRSVVSRLSVSGTDLHTQET